MRLVRTLLPAVLLVGMQGTAFAAPTASSSAQPLVVGVDHLDLANQNPAAGRVFEYTDFFPRTISVHSGDTIDYQAAPGSFHIPAFASSEAVARAVYPVAFADNDGGGATDIATGSGTNKVVFGLSNFPITGGSTSGGGSIAFNNGFGPPVCGVAALGEAPCTFSGGNDIEVIGPNPGFDATGNPAFVDQLIQINAPVGSYDYFCFIHPGMRGKLLVVPNNQSTTTQAQADAVSASQFSTDQAEGLATEAATNQVTFTGGAPGTRTYKITQGVGTPDSRVAIDEVFPTSGLNLVQGDKVVFKWADIHNVHTVAFPNGSMDIPEPFGFDCGTSYIGIPPVPGAPPPQLCLEPGDQFPESIGDPGFSPRGTPLRTPTTDVDAGLLLGTAYGVSPSVQDWAVSTDSQTQPGTYTFQCMIHDWMHDSITVTGSVAAPSLRRGK